jgi:hypothetical protein
VKLYVIYTNGAEVIDCKLTKPEACAVARREGPGAYVDRLTIEEPKDALRRLLGNQGGYAQEQITVYVCKRGSTSK